ncbi:LysR family transcriptional regulator [Sphingomonas sp. CLY1604]|uniref:LysR family transcriptional regulator n=1 Tax=Sphingomonas sp. CLY1604 TaxID=3457786 RepID=UPI003FD6CFF5
MIDRYLIRYCLAIVDHGSFSAAAAQCRVTQPTLSAGIAKLEAALGQRLFDRSTRRVRLTDAGAQFAQHARGIEAGFVAAERAVAAASPHMLIRIGVAPTLPTRWLAAALRAARAAGGDERIEIVEGRTSELQAKLDRGRIDALLVATTDDGDLAEVIGRDRYGVAMAQSHPLGRGTAVSAEEIAAETMIVRRHCEVLPLVSRFFTARGIRPFMAARTVSEDRAAAYVAAGLGITVMPRSLAGPGIAMLDLRGFDPVRRIGLSIPEAALPRLRRSVGYGALLDALRREADGLDSCCKAA